MSIAGQEEKTTADKKEHNIFFDGGMASSQELIEKGARNKSVYGDTSDELEEEERNTVNQARRAFRRAVMGGAYMNSIYNDLDNIIVAEDFGGRREAVLAMKKTFKNEVLTGNMSLEDYIKKVPEGRRAHVLDRLERRHGDKLEAMGYDMEKVRNDLGLPPKSAFAGHRNGMSTDPVNSMISRLFKTASSPETAPAPAPDPSPAINPAPQYAGPLMQARI